ncbi:tRNA (adenosine(37)-N6)-threonylcarbamoyltransferase complex ATPase subunit type 1 TsaE [Alisedimentitalea sp. MJ-SS2]|uniref:tRNA (adenosine(37)-N6)-threonylcarbamoyltransferase complex ATPase subunit type 1 TsaE n=1 Tax=Aliisedimentitalea sp. MJ-SS2 TaxID=3049795 RepID=UPI00290AE48B|nr:tRNA (adenosine(37)-N6)-threonylcarbamoyltransferase complex ATPase subunit type 1 TsaE [Alisedimentitalea sp. MJ-SS2]MDU8927947.1 tRNA (adenosine(37)-N6)-threonylcarbamoyltransferase complex ATPase subunit type 1 TsaE [Alisedimentitalea sp. MJ-SS2]
MTADLATQIGQVLHTGDVLLLSGDIGAGKTHFARSLIQSLQDKPEDVPSPTFTLVQVYDTSKGELWHTDLYRLSHADEVVELGLLEAFEDAICLVEWPDRLEELAPTNALSLAFAMTPEAGTRTLGITWTEPDWSTRLEGITNAIA